MHPRRHSPLDEAQEPGQRNAQHAQSYNRHEHRVGAVGAGVTGDQVTDAGDRSVEIREHHADQPAPDGEPQARDDEGHGRGQYDVDPEVSLVAAEGPAHLDQAVVDVLNALIRVDYDRKKSKKKNHRGFGGDFKAKPEH